MKTTNDTERPTVTVDRADLGMVLRRLGRDDFTREERAAAGRVLDVWEAGR